MDDQANTAAAERPSFVNDVERVAERVIEGVRDDAEQVVDRILGTGTAAKVETVAADVAGKAASSVEAAIAAVKAFGAGHVNLTQLGPQLTNELAGAKTKVEEAIVAVARHLAGLSS